MKPSRSSQRVYELQQLDPNSWTRLLRQTNGVADMRVTSVTTEDAGANYTRYVLNIAGTSDPVTLIGKRTIAREAYFYREFLDQRPLLAPHCWLNHVDGKQAWIVLSDTPHDKTPDTWHRDDVAAMVQDLASQHAMFWGRKDLLLEQTWLPFLLGRERKAQSKQSLRKIYPGWTPQTVSEHAMHTVQGLAPRWLEAANGLNILLDLDGWQGVIGEKQLRAMGDLLDDPLPMLHPLRELPLTLVHGYPGQFNWRVSVLGTRYLVDWQEVAIGPGVCDLMAFIETFGLLQDDQMNWRARNTWPLDEETIIDNYILSISAELGNNAQTRELRRAIPAARCLYILLTWLPRFNHWFRQLPNDPGARRDIWRSISTYDESDLSGTIYQPIAGLRPYLRETFNRFLRSFYQLS
ncbi:MAG: hypothetical protein ACPG8W_04475 [Candidatus Promineifilaceae bacterium]